MSNHTDAAATAPAFVDTPGLDDESPAGRVQLSPVVRGGLRLAVLGGAVLGCAGATAPHITSISFTVA